MGQGFYTCVYFGGIYQPPPVLDADRWYRLVREAAVAGTQAGSCYEAKNPWFGYLVADCGQGVSWDDDAPLISYEAFPLATLTQVIGSQKRFARALSAARKSYRRLTASAKAHGLALPPGELMLVNDYD
ncbi:MAG TPA: hypothetical protein PKG77_22540 [Phycisphaerae bacterium]|nr:hypothetical protein [Phycisphaerae bacterium]HQL73929.1 hypothetical protein [Phycisphaerae bacterium]